MRSGTHAQGQRQRLGGKGARSPAQGRPCFAPRSPMYTPSILVRHSSRGAYWGAYYTSFSRVGGDSERTEDDHVCSARHRILDCQTRPRP